jgi:hypothetical protein
VHHRGGKAGAGHHHHHHAIDREEEHGAEHYGGIDDDSLLTVVRDIEVGRGLASASPFFFWPSVATALCPVISDECAAAWKRRLSGVATTARRPARARSPLRLLRFPG